MAQSTHNSDAVKAQERLASSLISARKKQMSELEATQAGTTQSDVTNAKAASTHSLNTKAHAPSVSTNAAAQNATNTQAAHVHAHAASAQKSQKQGESLGQFVGRNLNYILSVVAVVCIAILGLIIAAPFISEEVETLNTNEYVSPYDWSKLDRQDGHYSYLVDGEVKSKLGIDVSENQHEIDWNAVAQDGIDFAMIRLGYRGATAGGLYLDEYFLTNIVEAENAGLELGVYFFSQAQTVEEAQEEADFVLSYLNGIELSYPIAFDSEESVLGLSETRTTGLDNETMTAIANAFCERIENAGYSALVYGNASDLSRYHQSSVEERDVWWAEYGQANPTAKMDIGMWQYTNTGQVAGIDGDVDMSIDLRDVLND